MGEMDILKDPKVCGLTIWLVIDIFGWGTRKDDDNWRIFFDGVASFEEHGSQGTLRIKQLKSTASLSEMQVHNNKTHSFRPSSMREGISKPISSPLG